MVFKPLIGALLAATAIAPAIAQSTDATPGRSPQEEYQRGYATTPAPDQANINAGGAAGTAALNTQAGSAAQASNSINAANQAQYELDRQAYVTALVQHDHAVDRTNARAVRQQNAYADAMAVWRVQVQACKKGSNKACEMPPPNPADFY